MIYLFIFILVLKICFIFYIISMINYTNLSLEVSQNNTLQKFHEMALLSLTLKNATYESILSFFSFFSFSFFFFSLGKCRGLNPWAIGHYGIRVPTRLDGRWFESILFHIITFLTKYSIDVRGYGLICSFYKRHGFFVFLCWILLQILN